MWARAGQRFSARSESPLTAPPGLGASNRLSDALRAELVCGFGEYHTKIATQVVLMDQLIAAVRSEERERCARVADNIARATWPAKAERLGTEIAAAIRRDMNP